MPLASCRCLSSLAQYLPQQGEAHRIATLPIEESAPAASSRQVTTFTSQSARLLHSKELPQTKTLKPSRNQRSTGRLHPETRSASRQCVASAVRNYRSLGDLVKLGRSFLGQSRLIEVAHRR